MSDLVAFLRARYDERERVALDAASTSRSTARMRGVYSTWVVEDWYGDDADDPQALVSQGHERLPAMLGQFTATPIPRRHAEHIALNDPAYVRDDIAAKRQLIDDLLATPHWTGDGWYGCHGLGDSDDTTGEQRMVGPCTCEVADEIERRLRLLAQPFRNHLDFDPAWVVNAT